MFKQRKGITPVIAIVLLLLVTVGAVGVVYTQFQNIANQGNTQFDTKARQVELTLNSVSQNSDNNDSMQLTYTNGQDSSVEFNQTSMLQISYVPNNGESGVLFQTANNADFDSLNVANTSYPAGATTTPATECFNVEAVTTEDEQLVEPGETVTCDTNLKFPQATQSVGIIVGIKGTNKQWSYDCSPRTSSSQTC